MQKGKKQLLGAGIASGMALSLMCTTPMENVRAAEGQPGEIMLGAFFKSDEDTTDTLYWSLDGVNFYELAKAYEDATPNDPNDNRIEVPDDINYAVETLHDPSIAYRDGYFWMMAGFATDIQGERRFVPMFGYSDDLVHWSYPNSGSSVNVGVTEAPPGAEKYGKAWDSVAPDFFVDDDGSMWVTVSMGYYANFHGDDSLNDIMKPYLIKVENLSLRPEADTITNPAAPPVATYSDAVPINLPAYTEETYGHEINNRIDGSLFKEGDTYYFVVKKDGVTNEVWKTKTLTLESVQNEDNWELVCDDAVTGFEGPCLTKFDGKYFMYTDKLKQYPPENADGLAGVRVNVASIGTTGQFDEWTGWLEKNQYKLVAHNAEGGLDEARHGTVITLTDPDAIKVIWDLKAQTRYADITGKEDTPEFASQGWYQKESYNASRYGGVDVCFWYENNQRQGVDLNDLEDRESYRGKEIYDPETNGWYWMDNVDYGKMAVDKDVVHPYTIQGEDETIKWVHYDQFGRMVKGQLNAQDDAGEYTLFYWFDETTGAMKKGLTQIDTVKSELVPLTDRNGNVMKDPQGNTAMTTSWYKVDENGNRVEDSKDAGKKLVYYDDVTGIMLYGYQRMGGMLYYFDEHDGTAINGWGYEKNGDNDCWYENGQRQGYRYNEDGIDVSYRGKEIYDPFTDAWYWCDNVQEGRIAKGKSVYQESYAGIFADMDDGVNGKWVTYDDWGKMIKGFDWGLKDTENRIHFHDQQTGAMAKGDLWIKGSKGTDENGNEIDVYEVSRDEIPGGEHWFFDLETGDGKRLN